MVTIKDISEKLGISISTVSKALNGASDVSKETRQLILDTALELGYRAKKRDPDSTNRKKICVYVENMGYENIEQFGYEIIVSFKLAATKKRWDVDVMPISLSDNFRYHYNDYMRKNNYSAGFLLGFVLHNDILKQMRTAEIPTVLLDNIVGNKNVACVGTDNSSAMLFAVEHLAKLGHTKIALLNGERDSLVAKERYQGYLDAMAVHEIPVYDGYVEFNDFNHVNTQKHINNFLSAGITGIICASDIIAHDAMIRLQDMGVSIPNDVSIVGYDDLPLTRYTSPPMTTLRQNRIAIGKTVCLMLEQIMKGNYINRVLINPELIERKSTAPPKKGTK